MKRETIKISNEKQRCVFTAASCIALFLLLFSFSLFGLLVSPAVCFLLCKELLKEKGEIRSDPVTVILTILTAVGIFSVFYNKWISSALLESVCSVLGLPLKLVVISGGLLLSAVSLFALYQGVGRMVGTLKEEWELRTVLQNSEKILAIALCIVSAFGVIGVCSKASFIYPFNDWNDANCFFTVGKSMVNGIVPYRDLLEQKGPLLYLMHGLAWFVSHDSFLGVYFLESICAAFFLYYSYKTIRLYINRNLTFVIPLMSAICYTAFTFKDGDSAEELSLPFIAVSIFLMFRAIKERRGVTGKEALIIGIMAGCVFWIKFSLIGLYLGWFIVYALVSIKERGVRKLLPTAFNIAAGVLVSTVPFIIYFGWNHALMDWLKVYIYDNLFLYSEDKVGITESLSFGFSQFAEKNKTIFNLCLAAMLASLCQKKKEGFFYITAMIVFEFLLIYMGGKHYRYYSFVMNAFIPLGLICICRLFENNIPVWAENKTVIGILTLCSILLSFYLTPNRYLFGIDRNELPQYRFAKIMHEEKKDPTLLNYRCLDGGFYTAANIFPNCKAFCKLNMDLQEMYDLQDRYANEGLCDFIVCKLEFDLEKYELIETMTFPYNDTTQTFYLYKLK